MRLKLVIPQIQINRLVMQAKRKAGEIDEAVIVLIDDVTEKIYQDARRLVPVDTGTLRDSIKRSMIDEIRKRRFADVKVEAFYGRFIEFEYGGVKRPATPFLMPAFRKHIPELIRELKRIVR